MKHIEKIKFWAGITLVFFAVLGGLIFYLESFEAFTVLLSVRRTSPIWESGRSSTSMTPIFLGLCGIAGAMLLVSVKPSQENKTIEESE